jgi:hypothetical protein
MTLIEPETIFRHAISMLSTHPARTETGLDVMLGS